MNTTAININSETLQAPIMTTTTQIPAQKTLFHDNADNAKDTPESENGNQRISGNCTSSSPMDTNASQKEPIFQFGPYLPILRKANSIFIDPAGVVNYDNDDEITKLGIEAAQEVLPNDAIVEAPSLVTPFLLKKHTIWPKKISELQIDREKTSELNQNQEITSNTNNVTDTTDSSDDVQVTKVINRGSIVKSAISNNKALEDYIRTTTIASLTKTSKTRSNNPILTIENYFKSSVGEMFLGIGLSRVRELDLQSKIRKLTTKVKNSGSDYASYIEELEFTREQLSQTRASNKAYKSDKMLECPHCPFKSEFAVVMSGHLENPHQNQKREFLCNWCEYKNRDPNQIVFHCLMEHKQRCTIDKPIPLHSCRYCPYECKSKRKMTSHLLRCEQNFQADSFLGPQDYGENELPAVTSKFILKDDIRTYEDTLKEIRLASYNPNILRIPGSHPMVGQQSIFVVPKTNGPINSHNNIITNLANQGRLNYTVASNKHPIGSVTNVIGKSVPVSTASTDHNVNGRTQLLYLLSAQKTNATSSTLSTLQYPHNQSSFTNGKLITNTAANVLIKQQVNRTGVDNIADGVGEVVKSVGDQSSSSFPLPKGSTFVICEICDGYIKDLSQLKSHMHWIHKVKIHQKTLESRPPLSCQRCQWRFFTDQGLERHLLGAHGLVTSNMQEQVDKGSDSGRCTVCGRAYANKLVIHMRDVHKSNLKPAHLSYKCTVCSATFNLYRLFENHVYSVHSDSVKRISSN